MSQPDTKVRILDAAERLFAEKGFRNTSLRGLTAAAGVNLAAVNYHFGSKEALLEALFERRLVPLNHIRREGLEKVREAARRNGTLPSAREAMRAFIEPTLAFRESSPEAESFVRLVGRAIVEADGTVQALFMHLMKPLFLLLYETLKEALPTVPSDVLFWRLHFALGAISHTMCMAGRFRVLPEGIAPVEDGETLSRMVLDFVTAGMEAPCD